MSDGMIETAVFDGGCMCGSVRYEVARGQRRMILCHCDMCRQATGSPLPGFISVAAARVTWSGQPAVYRSSSIAERGFCPTCGTPLFYRADGSDTIGLTAGSARIEFHPTAAYYSAERAPWLHPLDALPERAFAPAKDGVRRTARD